MLGDRAGINDVIRLDGKKLHLAPTACQQTRVLAYHKPAGEICSRADPGRRPTIYDRLPRLKDGRWIAVGRLDINTCGLILLTTDGELANRLMHPSSEIEREYAVRILGEVDQEILKRLRQGVLLEDGPACFESIQAAGGQGANQWFHVILREGRKREVRRLWESQGLRVSRLIRVRFGGCRLRRGLRAGHWDDLDKDEVNSLRASVGLIPSGARVPSGARAPVADEKPLKETRWKRKAVKRVKRKV